MPFRLPPIRTLIAMLVHHHRMLARYVVVGVAIGLLFWVFPRKQFNYDFEVGKPWLYRDLYAPFTFTIIKSADSLAAERQRIVRNFIPYYQLDTTVANSALRSLINSYPAHLNELKNDPSLGGKWAKTDSAKYAREAVALLQSVYKVGIIDPAACRENPLTNESSGLLPQINLLQGNKAMPRSTDAFYTSIPNACQQVSNNSPNLPDALKKLVCDQLRYNILCNKAVTDKFLKVQLNAISETEGLIQRNEEIIRRGTVVQALHYRKLASLQATYYKTSLQNANTNEVMNKYGINLGYFLLLLLLIGSFLFFLQTFHPYIYNNLFQLSFILGLLVVFVYMVRFTAELQQTSNAAISMYVVPYCVIPIVMRNFFGTAVAYYVHLVAVLLAGFAVPMGYEYAFVQVVAGLTAITLNERTYYWSQFFIDTAIIFLVYEIGYVSTVLILEGSLQAVELANVGWLVVNCFLTLLTYPLLSIFERLFGFVSDITLAELSYLNNPLLQQLSHRAPGTFWHSLQVSTLAEAAATAIGANALLTKVGALYHDVGKMKRPGYFIENQKTETNPHDDLPYIESAQIIKAHVTDGIDIARQEGLPTIIIDFIRTHHGTSRMEYFYYHYIKENPNTSPDNRLFSYPGPLPYSKETAVVMMADSIEAACRSLKNPTDDEISRLVDNIIDAKIRFNQFANCPLSFRDITLVRKVFKKQLRSLYHVRISYPADTKVAE